MPNVLAFIVTFMRDSALRRVLRSLAEQSLTARRLLVVDNAASKATEDVCSASELSPRLTYLAPPDNVGPAGGTTLAMEWALHNFGDADWLLRVDDDRPLPSSHFLQSHVERAEHLVAVDPKTGIVGTDGAIWDWERARLRPRAERQDLAAVHYVKTGSFPLYRLDMVREVGTFRTEFFFGMTEVDYGLRVQRAGWSQWAVGTEWMAARGVGRLQSAVDWRRYYSIRNTIIVLLEEGHKWAAWRMGVARAIGRPLVILPRSPSTAGRALRLGVRALWDARARRLGKLVDPLQWQSRFAPLTGDAEMPLT